MQSTSFFKIEEILGFETAGPYALNDCPENKRECRISFRKFKTGGIDFQTLYSQNKIPIGYNILNCYLS